MKDARGRGRTVVLSREPHKFKQGDLVLVPSLSNTVYTIKQCLYDTCGHSIYNFYGYFGEYVSEDCIVLHLERKESND